MTWYLLTLTISFEQLIGGGVVDSQQTDTSALTQLWPQPLIILASILPSASE